MATHKNYSKTMQFEKPNGIFIIFSDYEYIEDFPSFLEFLGEKLNTTVSEATQYPYSLAVEITLHEGVVIAMFHDDTGCCVRVPPGARSLADYIIQACYAE